MSDPVIEKIKSHPKYAQLKNKRNSFGWTLSILMLIVYYGYIALIAFDKAFLAQPLGAGVTTLGIPLGMGVIVFTIVITGIYVARANSEYDRPDQGHPRGRHQMKRNLQTLGALMALAASGAALGAGGDVGETAKQATNWTAITMFAIFVLATLWITITDCP